MTVHSIPVFRRTSSKAKAVSLETALRAEDEE